MSEKKLDNEEFRVVGLDNLEVIKGDANKLKLLITSYATIMEVQDAYIQKDLDEKKNKQRELEEKVASGNLEKNELKDAEKDLSLLKQEVRSLKKAYDEFSEARQRFLAIAKKALKLPKENFEQLAKDGWTEIEDTDKKKEVIDLQELSKAQEDAQNAITDAKYNDIFSSVDSNLIKEEVEKMMNRDITSSRKYGDTVARNIDADNFDENVSEIAEDIKNEVDKKKRQEIKDDNVDDIINEAKTLVAESPTIEFNVPPITSETGEWTPVQPPVTDENKSFEGFDGDTSIESFMKDLEERNERLKSHGEELNSKISDVKEEQTKAAEKQEQAKKEREAAKKRAEDTKRQIELLNTYRPKMDELRKANEEQEKLNSVKEAELQKENETLATINSETTAIETETAAYDEEASQSLEELKRLRAEFAGTKYDSGDTQMTSGGRKI